MSRALALAAAALLAFTASGCDPTDDPDREANELRIIASSGSGDLILTGPATVTLIREGGPAGGCSETVDTGRLAIDPAVTVDGETTRTFEFTAITMGVLEPSAGECVRNHPDEQHGRPGRGRMDQLTVGMFQSCSLEGGIVSGGFGLDYDQDDEMFTASGDLRCGSPDGSFVYDVDFRLTATR